MNKVLDLLRTVWQAEPLVVIGVLVSAVVGLAGHFHILLDKATVETVLVPLITAVLARPHVKSAKK